MRLPFISNAYELEHGTCAVWISPTDTWYEVSPGRDLNIELTRGYGCLLQADPGLTSCTRHPVHGQSLLGVGTEINLRELLICSTVLNCGSKEASCAVGFGYLIGPTAVIEIELLRRDM